LDKWEIFKESLLLKSNRPDGISPDGSGILLWRAAEQKIERTAGKSS